MLWSYSFLSAYWQDKIWPKEIPSASNDFAFAMHFIVLCDKIYNWIHTFFYVEDNMLILTVDNLLTPLRVTYISSVKIKFKFWKLYSEYCEYLFTDIVVHLKSILMHRQPQFVNVREKKMTFSFPDSSILPFVVFIIHILYLNCNVAGDHFFQTK